VSQRTFEPALPVDDVIVPPRLREVDPAHVDFIAESWRKNGQMVPIEVGDRDASGKYQIVAGAHRLAAARLLGERTIQAFIMSGLTVDEARLREVEENLVRHDLTEMDRAVFIAEWKKIYLAVTGALRPGRPSKKIRTTMAQFPLPFGEAVRERLNLSKRTINRAVRRADAIQPDVRKTISGTWLADHGLQLDALANLDPDTQRRVAHAITSGQPPASSVKEALTQIRGEVVPPLTRTHGSSRR
jgi:ParB family chromosome partitioning protein